MIEPLIALLLTVLMGEPLLGTDPHLSAGWAKEHRVIAHALGAIDEHTYTNSLEAFEMNYARGFRVFEVDLIMTRDGHLVAQHDWRTRRDQRPQEGSPLSLTEFKAKANRLHLRDYTPLDFRDVAQLMDQYDDVYVVTDTKDEIGKSLDKVVSTARSVNPEILDRIIPQIYRQEDLRRAMNLYEFPSVIYTLYRESRGDGSVLRFVAERGIPVVTMPLRRVSEEFVLRLKEAGARVFVHTVNGHNRTRKLLNIGVYGFYTDRITPSEMKGILGVGEAPAKPAAL